MLDTSILSDLVRQPRGRAAARIRHVGESAVLLSVFTAAEARFGALRSDSERLAAQLELVLERFAIVAFEPPGDSRYAELRAELERAGTPIGGNDCWIAAHALALDCTLVTANEQEFRRVGGLRVENWLR